MAAGLRLYAGVTLAILAVGLSVTPWIPRLVRVNAGLDHDVRWAWAITVFGFLPLALAPFRALVDAEQRGYVVNNLYTFQALLTAALSLAMAYFGLGVTGQSLAIVLGIATITLSLATITLRRHPDSFQGLREPPDPNARASLRKLSGPTLAVNIGSRISLLSDSIIIGLFLGGVKVTTLFVTQRLAVLAQVQLQGIGSSSWAALAELHTRGQHETFNRRLVELTRLIAILGMTVLAPIVAFNRQFVGLWLGPGQDGGTLVVLIAAINAMLIAVTSLWLWCFTATGQVGRIVRPILVSSAINVVASLVLTRTFHSIAGPLLGTLVAYLGVNIWCFPVLLHRYYQVSIRELAWAVAAPLLVGVPYAAGLWWLALGRPAPGWIGLAAEMSGSAALFLAFSAAVLLDPTDRAIWRARLAGLLPHRPGKVIE